MRYQLVLQWNGPDLLAFDELIELEDALVHGLSRVLAEIDGHDCGAGEMNIFLLTDRPGETFRACRALIGNIPSAAYRPAGDANFIRLWPEWSREPFVVQ